MIRFQNKDYLKSMIIRGNNGVLVNPMRIKDDDVN
jgi:hypothetical protein